MNKLFYGDILQILKDYIGNESVESICKPWVYIDQNVIGLHLEGAINLINCSNFYWVYSEEHFAEIRRSDSYKQYLQVLECIGAKLLVLEKSANLKITGNARLIEDGTPLQHYESYIDENSDEAFNNNLFDPILAWVNGGGNENSLRQLPDRLREQFFLLMSYLPFESDCLTKCLDKLVPEFNKVPDQMLEQNHDILKTRKAFGDVKGDIGSISGANQLEQIWNIVKPVSHGISIDRFFGFDPIDKQGYETWPIYLGIVNCCALLDILGFQAERKCRKIDKIPNVRSDSVHIGMGSFCSAILSEDKRLVSRAKAIYEFKKIKTFVFHLKNQANKRMQLIL